MMPLTCGNLKYYFLAMAFVLGAFALDVWACPACLPAQKPDFFNKTLTALFVLGSIPLVVVAVVAWRIIKIQKNEHFSSSN